MTFTIFISSFGDKFSLNILVMKRLSSSLNFLARALVIGPCTSGPSVRLSEALSLSQSTHFRARIRQTSYKDLVFARGEFLCVVGAKKVSLRSILTYYMLK